MSPKEEGKLNRDEVEALLQATREEPLPPPKPEPSRRVEGFSFHQPSRFSKSQLDKLRRIHEGLALTVTGQISRLLRTSAQIQLVSMDHIKWENLLQEAGDSVAAFTFEMNPFGHRGVVTVDGQLADACVERMLGGQPGSSEPSGSAFTDMDVRVFAAFVRAFLDPLPELWERIGAFEVELGPFVRDLQGLDVFTGSEDFFQLCFLVQSGVGSGQVALSAPFQAVRALPPESDDRALAVTTGDAAAVAALQDSLKRMQIHLSVVLGSADLKVGRLVRAAPGDVIVLDSRVGDPLEVRINNRFKFRGCPGTSNGKLAVKLITEE
jgi:flagellar motor switch protein FliM